MMRAMWKPALAAICLAIPLAGCVDPYYPGYAARPAYPAYPAYPVYEEPVYPAFDPGYGYAPYGYGGYTGSIGLGLDFGGGGGWHGGHGGGFHGGHGRGR